MKYHIITYGCQMNKSDSERLAARLERQKHRLAPNIGQADLIIINVCSVRQSAINRIYSKVRQLDSQKPRPKIILTGCLLAKDKKRFQNQVDEIWPIISLSASQPIKPECQSLKQTYLPIMTGCNNFCSYCVVPYTRGREKSRPASEIIREFKQLVKQGYKEIILLGQNVNSYQSKISFPQLLQILNNLPGKFKINFLTSHPKDMSDELIKVISQGKKISKQIHLPVQSGDNQILKKMNRYYTVGHYKKLIKKIRRSISQAEISTDIIVGFPGETKKQFQNTVKLIKEIGFKQIYTAAYSPRAGTAAAKLKDNIPPDEKKRRKRIVLDLINKTYAQ
ncbi:MAG: MiaB/RimO family radical SAM methylthiotransferase [Patescibacteria group bacterium]